MSYLFGAKHKTRSSAYFSITCIRTFRLSTSTLFFMIVSSNQLSFNINANNKECWRYTFPLHNTTLVCDPFDTLTLLLILIL